VVACLGLVAGIPGRIDIQVEVEDILAERAQGIGHTVLEEQPPPVDLVDKLGQDTGQVEQIDRTAQEQER
jgi:hypothetical protein